MLRLRPASLVGRREESSPDGTMACWRGVQAPEADDAAAADNGDGSGNGNGGMRRFATLGKDPTVRTDFLPDKDRQRQEEELREQLKKEWALRQVRRTGSCLPGGRADGPGCGGHC